MSVPGKWRVFPDLSPVLNPQRIAALLTPKTTLRRAPKSGQAAIGRHQLIWFAIPLLTKKRHQPIGGSRMLRRHLITSMAALAAATLAGPAAAQDSVKIGLILPMTGQQAST